MLKFGSILLEAGRVYKTCCRRSSPLVDLALVPPPPLIVFVLAFTSLPPQLKLVFPHGTDRPPSPSTPSSPSSSPSRRVSGTTPLNHHALRLSTAMSCLTPSAHSTSRYAGLLGSSSGSVVHPWTARRIQKPSLWVLARLHRSLLSSSTFRRHHHPRLHFHARPLPLLLASRFLS